MPENHNRLFPKEDALVDKMLAIFNKHDADLQAVCKHMYDRLPEEDKEFSLPDQMMDKFRRRGDAGWSRTGTKDQWLDPTNLVMWVSGLYGEADAGERIKLTPLINAIKHMPEIGAALRDRSMHKAIDTNLIAGKIVSNDAICSMLGQGPVHKPGV